MDITKAIEQSTSCIDALRAVLGCRVIEANSLVFYEALEKYWAQQARLFGPRCFIAAAGTDDVATAVKLLGEAATRWPEQCRFAIRSGGSSPCSNAATVADGIVLDLSNLKQTRVHEATQDIEFGAGCQWSRVYALLEARGRTLCGGRVASLGVGGSTTGGGISFMSGQHGFVCDNVVDFEVVLADGRVVHANDNEHADLCRALRGGSNNFGVITSIRMRTFAHTKFLGGYFVAPISERLRQFAAFEQLLDRYDPYAAVLLNLSLEHDRPEWYIPNFLAYTKADARDHRPAALQPFMDASTQIASAMRFDHLHAFCADLAAPNPYGNCNKFATVSFRNSARMMEAMWQIVDDEVMPLREGITDLRVSITFQPIPTRHIAKGGRNCLGLTAQDASLCSALLVSTWNSIADETTVEAMMRRIIGAVEAKSHELGVRHPFLYLNYCDYWQDPIAGYGPEAVQFLRRVSQQYDPCGMFQTLVPGGFKLKRERERRC